MTDTSGAQRSGTYTFDPKWIPSPCECDHPIKSLWPFHMWCYECGKLIPDWKRDYL